MKAPKDFSLQPPDSDFPVSEEKVHVSFAIITPISNTVKLVIISP